MKGDKKVVNITYFFEPSCFYMDWYVNELSKIPWEKYSYSDIVLFKLLPLFVKVAVFFFFFLIVFGLRHHSDWPLPDSCGGLVLSDSAIPWTVAHQSPPTSLSPWDFPGKNTKVHCHFLLQGILLMQGWNPHFMHCSFLTHAKHCVWFYSLFSALGYSFVATMQWMKQTKQTPSSVTTAAIRKCL